MSKVSGVFGYLSNFIDFRRRLPLYCRLYCNVTSQRRLYYSLIEVFKDTTLFSTLDRLPQRVSQLHSRDFSCLASFFFFRYHFSRRSIYFVVSSFFLWFPRVFEWMYTHDYCLEKLSTSAASTDNWGLKKKLTKRTQLFERTARSLIKLCHDKTVPVKPSNDVRLVCKIALLSSSSLSGCVPCVQSWLTKAVHEASYTLYSSHPRYSTERG